MKPFGAFILFTVGGAAIVGAKQYLGYEPYWLNWFSMSCGFAGAMVWVRLGLVER